MSRVRVLATSRAPLRVRGEHGYPVSPLGLPASTRSPAPQEILSSPSGRLFVERTWAASPNFELTKENATSIVAICWRLAGLPLALELAATTVRFLDPATLLSRLDRALSTSWERNLPDRQKTMRATLDWSYDLLSEPEKDLFARLSVFAGGFTLEAAEAVGGDEASGEEDVLVLLGNLVDQSLVPAEPDEADDGTRYRMLEPVRQYALERLEQSGKAEEARRQHARCYLLALAERAGPGLKGPGQRAWLKRLETELDNLRAAIGWSIDHGEVEAVAKMASATTVFWWLRGHLDGPSPDGGGAGERARYARIRPGEAPARRGHARPGPVRLTSPLGRDFWRRAWRCSGSLGDRIGVAYALGTMGLVDFGQKRYEQGLTLIEESVDSFLEIGGKRPASPILGFAAAASLSRTISLRARQLAEKGLSLAREVRG